MTAKRDPDLARRRILDAAAEAFATSGPAGARIDAIAADAGVNKRMLYHYFGDKSALFAAVLNDRLGGDDGGDGGDAMLPSATTALAEGIELSALDLRLMVWAAIARVKPGAERARDWRRFIEELAGEQNAGRLRADVDAESVALVLLGVAALPELLADYAGIARLGDGALQTLLRPAPADERSASRINRPRVRMLPQIRSAED